MLLRCRSPLSYMMRSIQLFYEFERYQLAEGITNLFLATQIRVCGISSDARGYIFAEYIFSYDYRVSYRSGLRALRIRAAKQHMESKPVVIVPHGAMVYAECWRRLWRDCMIYRSDTY